ncbi:uncharacterized protein DDB_G0284459-like [Asterias rubens]|uniref:uncharacterized protein DDB_G0284459-like n=1 Tax=Asterias rubens TaxID=7604 RepID=UPI00145553D2|nr:uncharacterized protein DDB_G0284459-like [Asterias rubens]
MSHKSQKSEKKIPKNVVLSPGCLALTLSPLPKKESDAESLKSSSTRHGHRKVGKDLFRDFQRENKHSFWNKPLADSVKDVGFLGFLEPWIILIKGAEKELECLREAYARRVLKPPRNFTIANLGDISGVEMAPIQQHQFIPLTEVLCLIISEMNKRKLMATQDTIRDKLAECYSKMPVPNPEIIHKSLSHLMTEEKIEQKGKGYMIIGLDKLPPDSPSGDEVETPVVKPKTKQPDDRVYLMFKDGALTKHTLPTFLVDKSTQTARSRSDSASPRPVSYPANVNMNTIYEKSNTIGTSSPSKQRTMDVQASPLQRSLSMRERRSPSKRNNFDRTSSMRAKSNEMENGYFTSDSEAKPSCFGKLLGKSAKKKAIAQDNTKHQTFSAQFPPSDIHDPFFNYNHWLGKSPQKVALNSVSTSSPKSSSKEKSKTAAEGGTPAKGMGTTTAKKEGSRKSLPKDFGSVKDVNHYKLEHGRLTQTAKILQQKYHDNAQESMPESEQEFLKPTQLYDEKHRTKVIAQQAQPVKSSKKADKMKHYFSSIQNNKPQQMQPFEGISTDDQNDSEVELLRRNEIAAEKRKQKLEQLKERRQARIFTAHKAMRESEMVDPMDYPPAGMELPASHTKNGTQGNPKEDMLTPEPMRRQVAAKKTEVKRTGPPSGLYPEALQTPKNYNGYANRQPEPQNTYSNYNEHTEHEQYYHDEEIDNYMRQEQSKKSSQDDDDMQDPMCSPQRDTNVFTAYPQHSVTSERREGSSQITMAVNPRPTSQHFDYMDNERPPPPPPIRFHSQADRSPGHQPPIHSVHPSQIVIQNSTGHPEYPNKLPIHQRVESLSSSTGDSGFNSPRSSLAQSHNNNSPIDHVYDPLQHRHNGTTGIPVLIKPIPRRTLDDVVDNQDRDFDGNRMIKSTSNPACLHSTIVKQSSNSDISVKRKFKSSDTVDANSDTSEKTAYSSRSRKSKLDRPRSFEVIGTV